MRTISKLLTNSRFVNKEVALNEILEGASAGLSSATLSNVNDLDTSQTLLAANSDRKGCVIFNDSGVVLYVALAATASATAFSYRVNPLQTLELFGDKNYTGAISGIWASDGSGAARVTELES